MADMKSKKKCKEDPYGNYMGVGMAIGIGVGVAFGAGLDNMGLGIAIGVALGPAFALGMKAAAKKRHKEHATSDTRAPDR